MNEVVPDDDADIPKPDATPNIVAHFYPPASLIETLSRSVPDAPERFLRMMENDVKVSHRLHQIDSFKEILGLIMAWSVVAGSLFLGYRALEITHEPAAAAVFVSLPVLQLGQAFIVKWRARRDSSSED